MYDGLSPTHCIDEQKTFNPVSGWFHKARNRIVSGLVDRYAAAGLRILDIGCGNCLWNERRLPVTGIDINKGMLEENVRAGRIRDYFVADLGTGLPPESGSYDMAVITEVLEHVSGYESLTREIHRVLKNRGRLILSVPFDTNLSLWKPLFTLQCFVKGHVLGDHYHKMNSGHINHFSPASIRELLERNGFRILEASDLYRMTIFIVAEKAEGKRV